MKFLKVTLLAVYINVIGSIVKVFSGLEGEKSFLLMLIGYFLIDVLEHSND